MALRERICLAAVAAGWPVAECPARRAASLAAKPETVVMVELPAIAEPAGMVGSPVPVALAGSPVLAAPAEA
jgi:hypothetical protein